MHSARRRERQAEARRQALTFARLYNALRVAEQPRWERYLARRVSNNGWDGETLLQELRHLPRSMPQGHRWFLLKIHLKAPMTLARIAKARADVEAEPCHLCGGQTDAVEHVTTCELVCGAYDIVSRSARLPANPGGMRTLMLQERMDGGTLAGIVAFYAAIWTTRRTCRKLGRTISVGELADIVGDCMQCPWLVHCMNTTTQKERRTARLKPPPAPKDTCAVYRSDGASRQNGWGNMSVAGAGAAYWAPGSRGLGAPLEKARRYLGRGASNNIAEYSGLLECMKRAARKGDEEVVFEVDSMLLARQIGHEWACRSPTLVPYYTECLEMGEILEAAGISWTIRHIYREYNQAADTLSNEAIDLPGQWWATVGW